METNTIQRKKTARIAASLFFFICVPLYFWEQTYVLSKIFVPQDPSTTAINLLSYEFFFRVSIVSHLVDTIFFVLMMMMFYRLFRHVSKHLSRLMLIPLVAQISVVFIFEILHYAALMVLKSEPRSTFDVSQQQEAAHFLLRIYSYGGGIGMCKHFVGLCFIPFGILVFRSALAPRIIGVLLIIGGIGYVADCFSSILLQRADYSMIRSFLKYTTLSYFIALLWFLVKGVSTSRPIVNNEY
jgi:uncharacterized membrane protein